MLRRIKRLFDSQRVKLSFAVTKADKLHAWLIYIFRTALTEVHGENGLHLPLYLHPSLMPTITVNAVIRSQLLFLYRPNGKGLLIKRHDWEKN